MSALTKAAAKSARVLILDVERLQGEIVHRFWDLGEMKGRRFSPDEVARWPRTICYAAAWYDQPKRKMFAAEWEQGGAEAMLRSAWDLYDQADVVVGHNIRRADDRWLKGEWLQLGLPSPRPWQTVDTLAVARREFAFESNTLDALCKRLGVKAKTDKYSAQLAENACNGDTKAQNRLRAYNLGDIDATRGLYDALRPYIHGHPHLGLFTQNERACPNCGGDTFTEVAEVRTMQSTYGARRCTHCGTVVRNSHMKMRATTRAAR